MKVDTDNVLYMLSGDGLFCLLVQANSSAHFFWQIGTERVFHSSGREGSTHHVYRCAWTTTL